MELQKSAGRPMKDTKTMTSAMQGVANVEIVHSYAGFCVFM